MKKIFSLLFLWLSQARGNIACNSLGAGSADRRIQWFNSRSATSEIQQYLKYDRLLDVAPFKSSERVFYFGVYEVGALQFGSGEFRIKANRVAREFAKDVLSLKPSEWNLFNSADEKAEDELTSEFSAAATPFFRSLKLNVDTHAKIPLAAVLRSAQESVQDSAVYVTNATVADTLAVMIVLKVKKPKSARPARSREHPIIRIVLLTLDPRTPLE